MGARFEAWIEENHLALFREWETEASEFLELMQWISKEHFEVLDEYYKFLGKAFQGLRQWVKANDE